MRMTFPSHRATAFLGGLALALAALTGCSPAELAVAEEPPVIDEPQQPEVPGLQPCNVSTEAAVGETIGTQIDALRAEDYRAAYLLAAPSFQAGISLEAFELIIRQGFSSLLEADSYTLSNCVVDPSTSLAQTTVTLRTVDQDVLTLRYLVTELPEGWRILGAEPVAPVSQGT